jgi:uncharacterized protein YuzB (UPF0349 family)
MDEATLEKEIIGRGLTAPRLTPDHIDSVIDVAHYHVIDGTTCTVCALVLVNGFVVIGKSAAASIENFDKELGQRIAFDDARRQIWALEGYLLREKLAQGA